MKNYYREYSDWIRFLGTKSFKRLCHKTNIKVNYNLSIGISFWSTNIITIYPSGTLELNTSGYRTLTTKRRLNQLTPYRFNIYQRDFIWYAEDANGDITEFVDGLKINRDGYFI